VIQGKQPVVAVPVFSWRRHQVRHTIKELSLKNSPDRDFSASATSVGRVEINTIAYYVTDRDFFHFFRDGNGVELLQMA
jgi:hypothetical protein